MNSIFKKCLYKQCTKGSKSSEQIDVITRKWRNYCYGSQTKLFLTQSLFGSLVSMPLVEFEVAVSAGGPALELGRPSSYWSNLLKDNSLG